MYVDEFKKNDYGDIFLLLFIIDEVFGFFYVFGSLLFNIFRKLWNNLYFRLKGLFYSVVNMFLKLFLLYVYILYNK